MVDTGPSVELAAPHRRFSARNAAVTASMIRYGWPSELDCPGQSIGDGWYFAMGSTAGYFDALRLVYTPTQAAAVRQGYRNHER